MYFVDYVDDLIREVLHLRHMCPTYEKAEEQLLPGIGLAPPPLSSSFEKKPKEHYVLSRISRFSNK